MYLDLIKQRRSVRTFLNKEIELDSINKIEEYLKDCTNPFNQSVKLKLFNAKDNNLSSGVTECEQYYIVCSVKKDKDYEMAFGFEIENVILYLESLGISSVIMAGTIDRLKFESLLNLAKDEIMPLVVAIGYKSDEMSKKERVLRRFLHADEKKSINNLVLNYDSNLICNEYIKNTLEAIRLAPSAKNLEPVYVILGENKIDFYLQHTKGYINILGDVQKIDLGIALENASVVLKDYNKEIEYIKENKENPDLNLEYIISIKIK